jgi:hypothetical protein
VAGGRHFRAWPRRRSDAPVKLRLAGGERHARMTDIGLGGAGLLVDQPLEVGTELEVVLHAPNRWDPLALPARVAWCDGRRAGVSFHPTHDRDSYDLFEMLGTQVFDT